MAAISDCGANTKEYANAALCMSCARCQANCESQRQAVTDKFNQDTPPVIAKRSFLLKDFAGERWKAMDHRLRPKLAFHYVGREWAGLGFQELPSTEIG